MKIFHSRQVHIDTVTSTMDQLERRGPSFAARLQLRDNHRCDNGSQLDTDRWKHEGKSETFSSAHIMPFAFASGPGMSRVQEPGLYCTNVSLHSAELEQSCDER